MQASGTEALHDRTSENGFYARHGKRWFDLCAAAVGLIGLALPMAVIGLLVRLVDGPPVFFRQERVGRHGRLFSVYKFRSMTNAEPNGCTITVAGDQRVTTLGRWLRAWKVDEWPQLLNVLKGDMSLVGPRPDMPGYMDELRGDAARLLSLRPGITGPATLAFRDEEMLLARAADPKFLNDHVIFPTKVRLNLQYMRELSLAADLGCIFQTLWPAGFRKTRCK